MSVLDVLSGLSTVAGKGFEGYAQSQHTKARDVLAQRKADDETERSRVLNALSRREINTPRLGDPNFGAAQGQAEADKISATAKPQADADALKITTTAQPAANAAALKVGATAQPEADAARLKATAVAPVDQQTHLANRLTDLAHPEPAKPSVSVQPGATPGEPGQAVVIDPNDPAHPKVSVTPLPGTSKGTGGAGTSRGFGQGGPLGAASGLASLNEMNAAHPNLKEFEKGFLADVPTSDLGALDRFRHRLAEDLQTHGFISAAASAEAERELASSNPALVRYGRNLKQWIVSDMNLSRGGTDARARMDDAVSGLSVPLSTMKPEDRALIINQIWEGREARLSGLNEAAPGIRAMLQRLGGGKQGAATPAVGSREAAVAHLKAQGKSDAEILKVLGPP